MIVPFQTQLIALFLSLVIGMSANIIQVFCYAVMKKKYRNAIDFIIVISTSIEIVAMLDALAISINITLIFSSIIGFFLAHKTLSSPMMNYTMKFKEYLKRSSKPLYKILKFLFIPPIFCFLSKKIKVFILLLKLFFKKHLIKLKILKKTSKKENL